MDERRHRTGRTRGPRPRSPGNAALARDWAWELASVEDLGCSRREVELRLRGVVDALVGLMLAESFSAQLAREVGASLVGLNATAPEALRRTLLLLTDRLLDGQPMSAEAGRHRLTRLLIELTAGWAEAAHRHVRTAQDEIHSAFGAARQHRPRDSATSPNPWFGEPRR
jgi:diguanylate cyclase